MVSRHYRTKRYLREKFIKKHLGGDDGNIIDGFIVDRGHKRGAEVHSLTDKGIIIIYNYNDGRLITKIIAREAQIRRYYKNTNREKPPEYKKVLKLARYHESLNYNSL